MLIKLVNINVKLKSNKLNTYIDLVSNRRNSIF